MFIIYTIITFMSSGGSDFTLNVSYNSISTLNPSVSTINLTRLDLGFNNLTYLAADVFINTPNLRTINLQNNLLSSLEPGIAFFLKNNFM